MIINKQYTQLCIVYFIISYIKSSYGNILGCGGYIRSDVEINYSQVQIKLLTQQRNLKFETECAPNNGYYFIPLYDKGDYILKVAPPVGWSFEPEEVFLKVDGEMDPCSKSEDINFFFKGFAVVGKVITYGSDEGPPGVTVTLKRGSEEIATTVTEEGGGYIFASLGAGSYKLVASHPKWDIIKKEVSVTIKDGNGDAGNLLVIGGYSLTGSIGVSGKIADHVKMILHSSKEVTHNLGCNREKPATYQTEMKNPLLCHAVVNREGNYFFSNLPVGKYTLVPHFTTTHMKYDIEPPMTDVYMGHSDYQVQETFKIKGRSLGGRVTMEKNGAPVGGAKITLNNDLMTETNAEGHFNFFNVKFGDYLMRVSADGVEFGDLDFKLDLDTEQLDIVPARYQTCFAVSMDSASGTNIPWLINIIGSNSKHEIQTGASGTGCLYLEPGEYKAFIVLTQQDEEAGIRFGPKEMVFKVVNKPVKNLLFSQFLGEIHGLIECLETCRTLTVSLRPSKGNSGSPRTTTAIQGKFLFKEVVPAEYLLSVDKEEWCWKERSILVSVNAKTISAKFEQTGFRLTVNSSHPTALSYVTNKRHTGKLEVAEGTSRECVSAPGKYVFTPLGCQKFGNSPLTWDTSSPQLLSLIASHHQVTGTLISTEPGPFTITVKSEQNPQFTVGPLTQSPTDKNAYPFELWLESGETAVLTPSSSSNLFQYFPPSFTVTVANECLFSVIDFKAERALFIKGSVNPPLKGVTISVVDNSDEFKFTTNAKGLFIAGPLNRMTAYTVTAEKTGFIFEPPVQKTEIDSSKVLDIIKMKFDAYQLSKIIVNIKDENDEPLGGVLVSMSGGKNYRQNSLTDENGQFAFESLMPRDYFLKPMMKEYNFAPPSVMAKIDVGKTVNVDIKGVRVAYSIFGQTISLNGEPEGEVTVEAIGIGETCLDLQEEALSDNQGNFRIRGLTSCDYKIRLKKGEGVNQHLDRALPRERAIKIDENDYKGIKIVVIRPFLQMDVAVTVDTDRQFLSSLTAEIYRDDAPDTPIHVVSLTQHPFFMLPPMVIDHRTYTVQLVSSLPSSQYSYKPFISTFTANSSFIKLALSFKPTLKSVDAEISHGTIFGLIFFVLAVGVTLNYNKLEPYLMSFLETYMNGSGSNKLGKSIPSAQTGEMTFSETTNVRKRTKVRKT